MCFSAMWYLSSHDPNCYKCNLFSTDRCMSEGDGYSLLSIDNDDEFQNVGNWINENIISA